MPTVTWTGGAGDNNWATGANWSGGSAPSAADTVRFDNGSSDVATGPGAAIALTALIVTNGYSGNWTGLVTLDTITTLTINGAGTLYRLSAPATTANLYLNPQTTVSHEGGTWATVYASGSGNVNRSGTGAWTAYDVLPGVKVTATSSNQTFGSGTNGGTIVTAGNITTYRGTGGDRLTTTGTAAVGTLATIGNGSIFNHLSSGTIAELDAQAGSAFPCNGSPKDFTITTTKLWAGAMLNQQPPGITITFTNPIVYIGKVGMPTGTGSGGIP